MARSEHDTDRTPPVAAPRAGETQARPEAAPGHYGPGYGDPTRHLGTDGTPAAATSARKVPHPLEPASAGGPKDPASPEIAKD